MKSAWRGTAILLLIASFGWTLSAQKPEMMKELTALWRTWSAEQMAPSWQPKAKTEED